MPTRRSIMHGSNPQYVEINSPAAVVLMYRECIGSLSAKNSIDLTHKLNCPAYS